MNRCDSYVDMGEHNRPLCKRKSLRPAKCSECPVYIRSIKEENAKLREQIHWLKRGDILHVLTDQEYIDQCERERLMRVSIDALDKDNAKLRELVRDMWRAIPKTESCGWDASANTCTGSDECHGECALWHRMRALGVEVDDAPDDPPMSDAARRVFDRLMSELDGDGDER